jgi:hypothetical protein
MESEIRMSLPENTRGAYIIIYNLKIKELKSVEVKTVAKK